MPTFVGGYYTSFANTRAIIAALGVEDWGYPDYRLEFPINNWLATNNRLNVRAGTIKHPKSTSDSPDEDGMLLMTRFEGSDIIREERGQDKAIKDWLIQEGGIRADDLEWISLQDRFGLTRTGIIPERDIPYIVRRVTDEEAQRWLEYTKDSRNPPMSLGSFVAKEDSDKEAQRIKDEAQK